MLVDNYGRKIEYIRVSVIDRCNLSCFYCMPNRNYKKIPKEEILLLEEIAEVVKVASSLGIVKVRLTGGEPLLRRNLEYLISQISKMEKIKEVGLTTNGILLKKLAKKLKEAGLNRINVSLDTLDPSLFKQITGGGDLNTVLEGIEFAKKIGFDSIKINCILLPFVPDEEREKIREYCFKNNIELQFIRYMNIQGRKEELGKNISLAHRPPKCSICNKIRLSVDGKLYPCLFSNKAVVIKEERSIKEAILKAVNFKESEGGQEFPHQSMASIGG